MVTQTEERKNLTLLGANDLAGYGNVGEGLALQQLPDGRRILWVAHVAPPCDVTGLDVTDPRNPKITVQTRLRNEDARSNSLCLVGDLLLVARETNQPGQTPAGLAIFDVARPEDPKLVTEFDVSGPHSRGAHYVWCVDGRYAHLAAPTSGFVPAASPRDHQPYTILDISNPARPQVMGQWWLPGTRQGDSAPPPHRHPKVDRGYKLHNVHVYPQRPDRAYLAFLDGGAIILDISDFSDIRMVSRWDYHPPFEGFTHTAMPFMSRDLLVVCEERTRLGCTDEQAMYIWVVDIREESNPVPISTCPLPPPDLYRDRAGWYGPHNIYENLPDPKTAWWSERYLVSAMFNGGVRVYDLVNPFRPEEVAYFVPPLPPGQPDIRMNDVYVDERGIIYAGDRIGGGIYVLEPSF